MAIKAEVIQLPRYVLMQDHQRRGPPLLADSDSGAVYVAIYGFSSKLAYDQFCKQEIASTTPYPLVKRFFQSLHEEAKDVITLMVLDAEGHQDPLLRAATSHEILETLEHPSRPITASFSLVYEQDSNAYRIEKIVE